MGADDGAFEGCNHPNSRGNGTRVLHVAPPTHCDPSLNFSRSQAVNAYRSLGTYVREAAAARRPDIEGPVFLFGSQPSSADAALFGHLAALSVRHGPPGAWALEAAPELGEYYRAVRAAYFDGGSVVTSACVLPGPANAYEALESAIDRRVARMKAGPSGTEDARGGTASFGEYDAALVHAASQERLRSPEGRNALIMDLAATAGIFCIAALVISAAGKETVKSLK